MNKVRLGVLISGGGSNMQSIIDRIEEGRLSAEVAVVISNDANAFGLKRAEKHGLPHLAIDHREFNSREAFDKRLTEELLRHHVDLVVLAGFMRLLTPVLLEAFPHRVMNIHPALLPSFPGTHVWQDQLDHGVRFAGCTVHFVDAGMDTGPIIIQAVVPVLGSDDADTLAARILKQEHRIYPQAIQLYAEGRLRVDNKRVIIDPPLDLQDDLSLVNPPLA